jgi:hypothetical protein
MATIPDNQAILDYWRRRKLSPGLTEAEWADFYHQVTRLLIRTRLPAEYADTEARQDLIHAFFVQKILQNARTTQAGDLDSAHVLHGYLKRFAQDEIREQAGLVEMDEYAAGDEEHLGEEIEACAVALSHDDLYLLAEAGIDVAVANAEADRFLATLGEGEWRMLRHHTCAEDDERLPMDAIAKRWQIASYHYKAKKLGITGQKGGFFQGYESTLLGGWLKKLRAEISPEWHRELVALLNLLCLRIQKTMGET